MALPKSLNASVFLYQCLQDGICHVKLNDAQAHMNSAMDFQVLIFKYYFADLENSPGKLWLRIHTEIEIPLWLQNHLLWNTGLFGEKKNPAFCYLSLHEVRAKNNI